VWRKNRKEFEAKPNPPENRHRRAALKERGETLVEDEGAQKEKGKGEKGKTKGLEKT